MLTMGSCGSRTQQVPFDNGDSAAIANADPTIYGISGDATTMNVLQLITDTGDTLSFDLSDANDAGKVLGGLQSGDRMAVIPSADKGEAQMVINESTLLGDWVMPNPLDGSDEVGIRIKEGGIAESIEQPNLSYRTWRLIRGQLELDDLAHVFVDLAAFLHRVDDRREVIVRKNHVRGAFRHVRTGDAHADADIRSLDGRRVVHAVAGHGGHHAAGAPRLNDANLVFGLHAGIDRILQDFLEKFLIGELVELCALDGLRDVGNDAQILADGNGGILVVAGDHDRPDARLAALLDRVVHFRAAGVDHAEAADKDHILLAPACGILP